VADEDTKVYALNLFDMANREEYLAYSRRSAREVARHGGRVPALGRFRESVAGDITPMRRLCCGICFSRALSMRRARAGSPRPDRMSWAEIRLLGGECAPGERLTGAGPGSVSRGVAVGDAQAAVDGEHGFIAVRGRCLAV